MPNTLLADVEVLSTVFWSAVAVVLIGMSFFGVKRLAKWMKDDDLGDAGGGFSLSDLRQLVKQGKMTPEEFEKAKAILLATMKAPARTGPELKSTDRPPNSPQGQ